MSCTKCQTANVGCGACSVPRAQPVLIPLPVPQPALRSLVNPQSVLVGLVGAPLSDRDLVFLAKSQGLNDEQAAIAAAVALGESGGITTAHNARPPDDSYGLWQINMLGNLGPARRQQLGIATNEALFDPQVNARAMRVISNGGTNWRPWSVFTNGSYQRFLPRTQRAVAELSPPPAPTASILRPVLLGGALGVLGWWLYSRYGASVAKRLRTA